MITQQRVIDLLHGLQQDDLALGIELLNEKQLSFFYERLAKYGAATLAIQRERLAHKNRLSLEEAMPPAYEEPSELTDIIGFKQVALGKVACVLLAGGQGTRLSSVRPKALVPVSPIIGKTLLQMAMEKTKVLSDYVSYPLQIAIIVSDKTIQDIELYLFENSFFGLDRSQITLVCQDNMPFLTKDGGWCLESPGVLAEGPNGNGRSFLSLDRCGVLEKWSNMGVEYINVIPIDNPLADPYPFGLIGIHEQKKVDIAFKAIERTDPSESVGVVAILPQGLRILEYSDIDQTHLAASHAVAFLANVGLISFRLSFVQQHLTQIEAMPWHLASKSVNVLDLTHRPFKKEVWKFESFIFDIFEYAQDIAVVKYLREDCYSPLKNQSGYKSLESVQRDLFIKYKKIYSELSGLPAPNKDFELASQFWYPTEAIKEYWKGRLLPEKAYIEPWLL